MSDIEMRLQYLENITPPINDKWRAYVQARLAPVVLYIAKLRKFASLKPGTRVCVLVTNKADEAQARLDAIAITLV